MSFIKHVMLPVSFASGIWIPAMLLCCIPWIQRQMLYLHWVTLWPGKWLEEPERAGFLKNQTTPFRIPTKDGERLFAWLIAPLGVYARHANDFIKEKSGVDGDVEKKLAFRLLREDPNARLLLYFHGNTATIAQTRRTEEYRMYSAGASDKIFVLAFDYRGFGKSTGVPSENGCLHDAEAVVDWALNVASIPPKRILLLGHSLGTATATGIAHHYMKLQPSISFAGIILCAGFTNAGNAFTAFSIAWVFPVLGPLQTIPPLQRWFSARMRDTWKTDERLAALVRQCPDLQLVLVHAEDDATMQYEQTEELWRIAIAAGNAASNEEGVHEQSHVIDLGEAGKQETWSRGTRRISKLIAKHGDHDTMMKWAPVSLAVAQCFELTK